MLECLRVRVDGGEQLFCGWKRGSARGLHAPAAADAREEGDAEGDPVRPGTAAQTAAALVVTGEVQLGSTFHAGLIQHHIQRGQEPDSGQVLIHAHDAEPSSGDVSRNSFSE